MTTRVELQKPFDLGSMNGNGVEIKFVANLDDMSLVVEIINIVGLTRLEGNIQIKPWHKTGYMLTGELRATAVQECVVTLEPISEEVVEPFERTFISEAEATQEEPDEHVEVDLILEAEDPPEVLIGHSINLLEIVAEHLALGLTPWPRVEGAQIDAAYQLEDDDVETGGKAPNPFDVLKNLKH